MFTTRSALTACLSMSQRQLEEEAMRVGVLLLRAVELLQALGGLLEAQVHATQELSDPSIAGTHVEPPLRRAIRAPGL